ncbi:hypothetical protein BJ165DRAFT_1517094 [Panaeolus papilionaceus]|nr:hypothetical protein BJ165DRAFT_1517094 [Panaeolus papilionaceus]
MKPFIFQAYLSQFSAVSGALGVVLKLTGTPTQTRTCPQPGPRPFWVTCSLDIPYSVVILAYSSFFNVPIHSPSQYKVLVPSLLFSLYLLLIFYFFL